MDRRATGPPLQKTSITRFRTTRNLYAPGGYPFPRLRTQKREEWFWLASEARRNLNLGQRLTEGSALRPTDDEFTDDWALVELDREKFDWNAFRATLLTSVRFDYLSKVA